MACAEDAAADVPCSSARKSSQSLYPCTRQALTIPVGFRHETESNIEWHCQRKS